MKTLPILVHGPELIVFKTFCAIRGAHTLSEAHEVVEHAELSPGDASTGYRPVEGVRRALLGLIDTLRAQDLGPSRRIDKWTKPDPSVARARIAEMIDNAYPPNAADIIARREMPEFHAVRVGDVLFDLRLLRTALRTLRSVEGVLHGYLDRKLPAALCTANGMALVMGLNILPPSSYVVCEEDPPQSVEDYQQFLYA